MNYKILFILFLTLLASCEQNNLKKNIINQELVTKYTNTGFTLVYNDVLKKEKKISKK